METVADLLETIVAATRCTLEAQKRVVPISDLAKRAGAAPRSAVRFRDALSAADRINVIAECKRRSPSKGVLRRDYEPASIARGYADAGAAAISVLTEPSFFDGSLDHLRAVRARVDVPLLRKDFVVDEYQLFEAREAGADAVLLIVAALADADLRSLHARAVALDLDALVEVHNRDELARAIDAGARIVGVNNRNLRTLAVDVGTSEKLAPLMPRDVIAVAESGLKSREEIDRLRAIGYAAFLIGERFMAAHDPGVALRECVA
jgi:indole-3-glycerol phosphate synthase